jgi:hypothetical protein
VLCFGLYRDQWDFALLLMPLYASVTSLILIPLGVIWYVRMAWQDRNPGFIRLHREPAPPPPPRPVRHS